MSVTDGTFVCALCGEWLTGCSLCGTAPLTDRRAQIEADARAARDAETEMWRQEQAIKRSAWERRN